MVQFSSVVKVEMNDVKPVFTVQPNPVENKTLHISFENMVGDYDVSLVSTEGSKVFSQSIKVSSANEIKNIVLEGATAAGVYEVVITDAKGTSNKQTVYVQ